MGCMVQIVVIFRAEGRLCIMPTGQAVCQPWEEHGFTLPEASSLCLTFAHIVRVLSSQTIQWRFCLCGGHLCCMPASSTWVVVSAGCCAAQEEPLVCRRKRYLSMDAASLHDTTASREAASSRGRADAVANNRFLQVVSPFSHSTSLGLHVRGF